MYEEVANQAVRSFRELIDTANFRPGSLIVIGGSSSEIHGGRIGKDSQNEIGTAVVKALMKMAEVEHLELAFQCCEHLNRALVVERAIMERFRLKEVSVVPWLHAGGAF